MTGASLLPTLRSSGYDDPRAYFMWRLPAASGAHILTDGQIDRLKELPDEALVSLLERVETAVKELELLRQQLATRWVVIHPCPVCGAEVVGRAGKVYCAPKCKQAAYSKRHELEARNGR